MGVHRRDVVLSHEGEVPSRPVLCPPTVTQTSCFREWFLELTPPRGVLKQSWLRLHRSLEGG